MATHQPETISERARKADFKLAWIVLLGLLAVVIGLAFDSPPPDPDYYVYLDQAKDMARGEPTDQKFSPGFPLLMAPFSYLAPPIAEAWTRSLCILSFAALGLAIIRLARRWQIVGVCLVAAAVLANRYTITTALNCTSHLPFAALAAWTFVMALEKRWVWAYALSAAAVSVRYNGLILPPFVAIAHAFAVPRQSLRGRIVKSAVPLGLAIVCLLPVAAWLSFGTESGVGSYLKETELRGTAGLKVAQYIPAGSIASFLDETASEEVRAGGTIPKAIFSLAVLALAVGCGFGLLRLWNLDRIACLWIVGSLAWWLVVHMRFAEVGGVYFYSTQTTWLVWVAFGVGMLYLAERRVPLAAVTLLPLALVALGGAEAGLSLGVAILVWIVLLVRVHGPTTAPTAVAACLFALGIVNGWEKVYQANFRPAAGLFLDWAAANPKVLVSPYMLDQWRADGVMIEPLVSEETLDGADLVGSFEALEIRFAAISSREMEYRSEEEFLKGHEFFLGGRYKTSLRPYGVLLPIYRNHEWELSQEFKVRHSWIRVYKRPDTLDARDETGASTGSRR